MNTIDKFLTNSSKSHPEKLALIDENSKFTFLELEEKVNKFSSFLNQFPEKSVILVALALKGRSISKVPPPQ